MLLNKLNKTKHIKIQIYKLLHKLQNMQEDKHLQNLNSISNHGVPLSTQSYILRQ